MMRLTGRTPPPQKESCICLPPEDFTAHARNRIRSAQRQRPVPFWEPAFVNPGDHLLSPVRTTIGRTGLASEFGMGSGVSPSVWSPGSSLSPPGAGTYSLIRTHFAEGQNGKKSICRCRYKHKQGSQQPFNQRLIWSSVRALVPVSLTHFCASTPGLST
jgi:hypothetical protein